MSHITSLLHRHQGPANAQAMADCVKVIQAEHSKKNAAGADDLLALRNRMKESKGIDR